MYQDDPAAAAEDRSRFYWWLAEWFLGPPDAERLSSLPETDALDIADGPHWHALARARPVADPASLERLGVEYTRLFSGMQEGLGPPPPFESVWREDRLIGESTVAVIEAYAAAGFADIESAAGPQDHITVELKFIALLALREAEAWRAGDADTARRRLEQQQAFLDRHLAIWVPKWSEAVIRQANEPLYAALANLLRGEIGQVGAELAEATRQDVGIAIEPHE
jgi:TorA maturation chaperone TorD